MSTEYFMKLDGISGGSTDAGHKGEIDVESWSWGAERAGGAAAKAQFQDFHFVMKANRASPPLLLHCASGAFIPSALLTGRFNKFTGLKITLFNVLVTGYEASANAGEAPGDEISLRFSKCEIQYIPAPGSSPVAGGWDIKNNKAT